MIQNDQQLQLCIEQLERMYRALAEIRRRVRNTESTKYRLMAEGPVDEIRRLQTEIDTYLGVVMSSSAEVS